MKRNTHESVILSYTDFKQEIYEIIKKENISHKDYFGYKKMKKKSGVKT